MARPQKQGCDYFPVDVDIFNDDKFIAFEILLDQRWEKSLPEFTGEKPRLMGGFSVVFRILAEVYRNGYFYPFSEFSKGILSHKAKIPAEVLSFIVGTCLEVEIFDQSMYDKHQILTSEGIQKRYVTIKKRSATELIDDEHNLLPEEFTGVSREKTPHNPRSRGSLPANNPVKKRKEKKRKENIYAHTDSNLDLDPIEDKLGDHYSHFLNSDEYANGDLKWLEHQLDKMEQYYKSKGVDLSNYPKAAQKWLKTARGSYGMHPKVSGARNGHQGRSRSIQNVYTADDIHFDQETGLVTVRANG